MAIIPLFVTPSCKRITESKSKPIISFLGVSIMKKYQVCIVVVLAILYIIGRLGAAKSAAALDERAKKAKRAGDSYSYSSGSSYGSSSSGSYSYGSSSSSTSSNSKWCIVPGCHTEKSVEGGQYCFKHKCHVEGCTNKRVDGDWSCEEHGGVVGRFDK